MNSGALKEILKVEFLSFTKEEIENIMDEELEKSPEEMDTELIEMCLDILTGKPKEKADEVLTDSPAVSEKAVKKIKFKKGILVAAIIALFITVSVPVGANIFDIDIPRSILKIYEDRFKLDTVVENREEILDYVLSKNNLDDVVLPKFLFSDCEVSNFEKDENESIIRACFEFACKSQNINGKVTFQKSDVYADFFEGISSLNKQYRKSDKIILNGIDVFVFCEEVKGLIVYFADGIEYTINLNGVTFDKVVEIASTL